MAGIVTCIYKISTAGVENEEATTSRHDLELVGRGAAGVAASPDGIDAAADDIVQAARRLASVYVNDGTAAG